MARSTAYTLLTNNEPHDEIREEITPALLGEIDVALIGVRNEMASAITLDAGRRPDRRAALHVELGKYLRFAGGGWPPEHRKEWIEGVEAELNEYPFGLVRDSIVRARRRVEFPAKFVAWVVTDIEEAVDKLKLEESRLSTLREIGRA